MFFFNFYPNVYYIYETKCKPELRMTTQSLSLSLSHTHTRLINAGGPSHNVCGRRGHGRAR